jgi:hypothetical protein
MWALNWPGRIFLLYGAPKQNVSIPRHRGGITRELKDVLQATRDQKQA